MVKKYVERAVKEGDGEAAKEQLAEELYPDGQETSEEKANLTRLETDIDQELLRREKDTKVNTILRLRLNTSKINALKKFKNTTDEDGENFDSRKGFQGKEWDGDANGAYNIARKGLMLLQRIAENPEGPDLYISNYDWDKFVQGT